MSHCNSESKFERLNVPYPTLPICDLIIDIQRILGSHCSEHWTLQLAQLASEKRVAGVTIEFVIVWFDH